jgi:hypothetical protein
MKALVSTSSLGVLALIGGTLAGCNTPDATSETQTGAVSRRPPVCDMCIGDDGVARCCDNGQDPNGNPNDTSTCQEYNVQHEFWTTLGDCRNGGRCRNDCINSQCQAFDQSTNSTYAVSCPKPEYLSSAYKQGSDAFFSSSSGPGGGSKEVVDHTYFCLLAGGTDCYTITAYGFLHSRDSGGEVVPNTTFRKDEHQACLARYRASNFAFDGCGTFSEFYGVYGVCHQHTNRGQLSMHNTFMNPQYLKGGNLSLLLFGAYGNEPGWSACRAASNSACRNVF